MAPRAVRVSRDDDENSALLRRLKRKYIVLRFASRTALGEEIVNRYRQELESGARLRWQIGTRLDEARAAALARCPARR